MSKVIGSQGASIRSNIHVWMLFHDCLHDHVDDLFVLERLGRQVLQLLLLLGLPILCYFLLQADPAIGTSYRLICSTQQQVVSVAATVITECMTSYLGLLYSVHMQVASQQLQCVRTSCSAGPAALS